MATGSRCTVRTAAMNFTWYGFNLQKGHLYGTTDDGLRYVSACRQNKRGEILVYCQMQEEEARWEADYFRQDSVLGVRLLVACRERNETGLTRVEVKPASLHCIASMMEHNGKF